MQLSNWCGGGCCVAVSAVRSHHDNHWSISGSRIKMVMWATADQSHHDLPQSDCSGRVSVLMFDVWCLTLDVWCLTIDVWCFSLWCSPPHWAGLRLTTGMDQNVEQSTRLSTREGVIVISILISININLIILNFNTISAL